VRATKAEAVLSAGGSIAEAQAALSSAIAPIDDLRSTREDRLGVAARLLAGFWAESRRR
jgi:CO/xanthine dehydrogenase FAD-binding subunit